MLIGCTRKAAKTIGKPCLEQSSEQAFGCWHVMEFEVLGDKILLFMNEKTRFPLFVHNPEAIANLDEYFYLLLAEALRYLRIPQMAIHAYLSNQKLIYTKAWNRSVLSQMSELAHIYKSNILHGKHKFYSDVDASVDYSEIPCVKLKLYPKDKMHEAMMDIYGKLMHAS